MNNKKAILSPLILTTFLLGLIFSIFVYMYIVDMETKSSKIKFDNLVERELLSIEKELELNVNVLYALKSYHKTVGKLTRSEFNLFTLSLIKEKRSIQGVSWIPRVVDKDRKEFESNRTKELGLDIFIKEKTDDGKIVRVKRKKDYFPVDFVEPLAGNKIAYGFDISSNKTRLDALTLARETNTMLATGRIQLVQDIENKFAFLVLLPVFEKNTSSLEGFYTGVFRIKPLVENAIKFRKNDSLMLNIRLVDTTNGISNLLYTNSDKDFVSKKAIDLNILGRTWTLYSQPSEKLLSTNNFYFKYLIGTLFIYYIFSYLYFNYKK